MSKIRAFGMAEDCYMFYCPGCNTGHMFRSETGDTCGGMITWKRDKHRCYSFIKDDKIRFLEDCTHELAGKTVDLPDWEDV